MPSKLPAVQMPAPPEVLSESHQPLGGRPEQGQPPTVARIDNILEELSEKNMPSDDDNEGEIVTIDARPKLSEEEVFKETPQKEEPQLNSEIGEVPDPKRTSRRKYQRKGEMSEKQKAHLERIRAKALENKNKRKEEKEEFEKEKAAALEEKREQKRLEDEQKKQEKEIERQAKEAERLASAMSANMYSKEDLENAMINAIHTYDTHRKEQKAIKRKKQAEEAQRAQQTRLIQQAINPQQPVDPWRRYFS